MIASVALVFFAQWKYERLIDTGSRTKTVSVAMPPSIYANAQSSLDDLRVVDRHGLLVPFMLRTPEPASSETWVNATLTDEGFVPGNYSQVVADLGPDRGTYGILDIATPRAAFATTADVEASDDRATWRVIRTGAPIYDYRRDGLATNTRIAFPSSTARYMRVRILDRKSPFPIDGIRVANSANKAVESTRYALALSLPSHDTPAQTTSYGIEGIGEVPIDRLRLASTTSRFARSADVETSDDGVSWSAIASQQISRTGPGRDSLFIDFGEAQARHWRLVIHDGDDAPLAGVDIEAFGAPRRIDFDASPSAAPYRLIYGNPSAPAPSFDYAATHGVAVLDRATDVALGKPIRNPAFVPAARPWTDRNPWVLWLALGIAIVGIGGIAVRTMARSR
ncbi:MAG TPA: DUF3999 family protein [Candidatus Tyrphobacter sp.]